VARGKSTSTSTISWATNTRNVQSSSHQQKRFHSSSPNSNHNKNSANSPFTTISTLSHLLAAGTGTFASTLLALYLATIVETSAHSSLYEYFPHWYSEVHEEDLPNCLKARELARRATGIVEINRLRGVGEGRDSLMMGLDGWMEGSQELLAEVEFERRQEQRGISTTTLAPWQRRMTQNRADIIEEEEKEFSRGILSSANNEDVVKKSKAESFMDAKKKIQEEAAKKLQEQLLSVAMTA